MCRPATIASGLLVLASLAWGGQLAAQASPNVGPKGEGTEDRAWVLERLPDPTSPERFDFEIREHVKIEMRDGVRLDAALYLPNVSSGPSPCVLVADGYGWSPLGDSQYHPRLQNLASRGYAAVHVSYRGIAESEGEETLYNEYGRDGYDLVEWMAGQDWCNGQVGMFGSSLVGLNQWQVAKEAPPHLRAIVPDVACADCYEYLWYPGGMLPGPGREQRSEGEYDTAVQHRNFDGWWRDRSVLTEDLAAIARNGIAVMATGGWQDYITAGNVQAFADFANAGGEGKLMLNPGAHSPGRSAINGPYHYDEHLVKFFDRYLRGEDNGFGDRGSALIFVNGPDQWRYEETWPIPDTRYARLHLTDAASGSIGSLNDGSLSPHAPAADASAVNYDYDPDDGPFLPTMRHSGNGGITRVDMRPFEEQVSTWTTGPLDVPTEVTGKYELEFWAEATAEDTDFVLQVSDVAPDGTSTQVTSGYLNAPRNDSRATPRPLRPGEVRQYSMDTQAMSHVFNEGHRIRISLAGGTMNADDDRPGGEQGPANNPDPATVTIYQDADRPSAVVIPVIGWGVLPGEISSSRQ
ncbi:MAG: CocE/NonD family hydrolase [Gemmatimonadota bacterium]